jgi:hypothetical protein
VIFRHRVTKILLDIPFARARFSDNISASVYSVKVIVRGFGNRVGVILMGWAAIMGSFVSVCFVRGVESFLRLMEGSM